MFYIKENGMITKFSNKSFDNAIYTDENIIRGYDHKFYFESQTKTAEYLRAKNNYEKAVQIRHRITELKKLLSNYDYIGTKIATGRATKEEYATEIQQMIEWANEINQLEAEV